MRGCADGWRNDGVVDVGVLLLLIGAVLGGSVAVALVAARIGIPSLVAFLGLGMLLGSDGLGGSTRCWA